LADAFACIVKTEIGLEGDNWRRKIHRRLSAPV
jgi:hypothetical protein